MIPSRTLAVFASGLFVGSVSATTIVPTFQNRFISTSGQGSITAPDFGVFDASLVGVNQHSFIEPFLIHGEGEGLVGDPPFLPRDAQSTGEIIFTLDEAVEYRFQGEIQGAWQLPGAGALSTARLRGPGGIVQEFLAGRDSNPPQQTFDVSGILPAGQYTLFLETHAFNGDPVGSFADGSYDCDFSIVPEPMTALLLLVGICALRSRL